MTGAMYAAVSGMRAHMDKLNVIGNNVANVNTYGYKTAITSFKEALYSTVRGGSNGSASVGGVNPSQLGYGCSIGTIDLNMTTGDFLPTGISSHCMIDGDGFFLVGDKPAEGAGGTLLETEAANLELTRVGNFRFDSQGYLVDGDGKVVYGFVARADGETPGKLSDGEKPSGQLVPIRLPLMAKEGGALPAGSAVYPGVGGNGMNVYDQGGDAGLTDGKAIKPESISIDEKTGRIICTNSADKSKVLVGYIAMGKVDNPSGVTHTGGPYYRAFDGAGSCSATALGDAMKGYNLNNATGADAKTIFAAGETKLLTNGLESSGTDIATEFSEMITAQRGYQANTRIITVTDTMLEELVNIKR